MFNTTDLASRVANFIGKELELGEERRQVLYYSLDLAFSALFGLLLITVVSCPFNLVSFSLLTCLAGAGIRLFSGGAHCSSAGRCAISGAIVFPSLAVLTSWIGRTELLVEPGSRVKAAVLLIVFASVALGLWAPAETSGKPIYGRTRRYSLKGASIIVACLYAVTIAFLDSSGGSWLNIVKSGMLVGGLWQSFTLSPPAYRLLTLLDKGLMALKIR